MLWYEQLLYVLRIILAGVCGALIGLERKNRSKEAGIRTHFVVACGAALMMVVSKYAFSDVIQAGAFGDVEVRLDPSRVASTIASGIGFLGAGMIFVHKGNITGLTTAAGIWATSGVGMAIGSGMYIFGICCTVVVVTAQYILHLNFHKKSATKVKTVVVNGVTEVDYQSSVADDFGERGITILDASVENLGQDKQKTYTFKVEMPNAIYEDEILGMIRYEGSIK